MRVAVVSDIHANLAALEAVLAAVETVDAVWHLGDVLGYEAQPNEVVDRLDAAGAIGVRGNHDAAALGVIDTELFNADARRALEWTPKDLPKTSDDHGNQAIRGETGKNAIEDCTSHQGKEGGYPKPDCYR